MTRLTLAVLPVFRLNHFPARGVMLAVSISTALVLGGIIERLPVWGIVLVLIPWQPICWFDVVWQTRHTGVRACLSRGTHPARLRCGHGGHLCLAGVGIFLLRARQVGRFVIQEAA